MSRKNRCLSGLAVAGIVAIALAQSPPSDDAVWSDFTTWLHRQKPNSKPGDLIRSYREDLLHRGLPEIEARRRVNVVSSAIFSRRKGVEILWDKVYAGNNPIFLQTPSPIVMTAIEGRPPGKALDIGMGQGRNSVYLASQGWDVTGFDPSTQGVRIARSNAEKAGVNFRALVARDDEFDYGSDRWDLILITYVRDVNQADADRFWKALKPGGILVYENGADENNAVLKAFLKYQILRFNDVQTHPEWNPDHLIRVQQMIARKPAE